MLGRRCYLWLALIALWFVGVQRAAADPEVNSFDLLQVGARTYTNVTVTTRAKSYVFIVHQGGMANLKVADLPVEVQEKLGYDLKPKVQTNAAAAWAKETLKKMETPEVKQIEQRVLQALTPTSEGPNPLQAYLTKEVLQIALGAWLVLHLFFSWCSMLICRKAGREPGAIVWLPILQVIPLLRAADMSGWWFLALPIPVLNLVAAIMWCVKITQTRGKGFWTALFLILPPTSLLAFLYLAFSSAAKEKAKPERRVELMSLEAI